VPEVNGALALEECLVQVSSRSSLTYRNWLGVIITNEPDEVSWALSSSKTFTSQSLYKFLTHGGVSNRFAMKIWKCRVPLKIRIFSWQLLHDRIQTAQQLKARQWKGSILCKLCKEVEDVDHLFFSYPLAVFV
jgi:hypothetical protein